MKENAYLPLLKFTGAHIHTHTHTPSLMKNHVLIKSTDSTKIPFGQSNYIIESLIRFQQRSLKGEQVLTIYFK